MKKQNVKSTAKSHISSLSDDEIIDMANGQMVIPGMGKRMLAYMIDFSAVFGVGIGLHMFILLLTSGSSFAAFMANLFTLSIFLGIVNAGYHIYMEGNPKFRATLGKMIMGLQVIDTSGQFIDYRGAAFRFGWRLPSILSIGLLYLMAGRGSYGLTLHDRKTETVVTERGLPSSILMSGLRVGRVKTLVDKICLALTGSFIFYVIFNLGIKFIFS